MSNKAITINNLGKMYKLYKNPKDKILDAFNLNFLKKDYYEEFWALREMNLEIRKGERIGLIGNNGAGKSTLLKLIIGNVTPTEGTVQVNGEIQALMELGTGFHPEFTGRQNIRASLAYRGLSSAEIREKEEEIIDFSELEEFIDQPIRTYSAGMNARLAFSTATSILPDILIVDEVLGAGDAYFAGKCVERMKKITDDSGATVVFVSHDLNSVLQLCDRIIWIDRGTIRMKGNPVDVVKEYTATVRKREELRLKARDQKRYNKAIEAEVGEKILFRLIVGNEQAPQEENKVYSICITNKKHQEIATIDIGGPMDNGQEQDHYIIVDKEYTNWSTSKTDEHGTYRSYSDIGGKYKHAPFKVHVYDLEELRSGYMTITGDIREKLEVQVYENEVYRKIGELEPTGFKEYKVSISDTNESNNAKEQITIQTSANNETEEQRLSTKYDYGNHKIEVCDVQIRNSNGDAVRILEVGEKITLDIKYWAHEEIVSPVFVFCIYTPDGKCASQWVADKNVYGQKVLRGKGCFQFKIDKLFLGKGSYIASVGIFNGLSSYDVEAESYHVIDRSIHFEIRQAITDTIDRGICLQPFEGMIIDG